MDTVTRGGWERGSATFGNVRIPPLLNVRIYGHAMSIYNVGMPELYHVMNRGVDKRSIVEDDEDRIRFVHNLFMLNNKNRVDPNHRFKGDTVSRELAITIHAWCLMPNHYHLLVSEIQEGSLSLFMRKLNMGYAKYFNEKYHRTGYLWQGVFRKINVQRDAHFLHIPYYIHLNPLDLVI